MSHIFISYARKDAAYAVRVERDLRQRHLATWRDTRDLDTEQDFTGEIERAIRDSSHVVVCLTQDVRQRLDSFVRREIAYALGQDLKRKQTSAGRLPVIPLVFPGGELPVLISTWTAIFVKSEEDYPGEFPGLVRRLQSPGEYVDEATYHDSQPLVDYLNALHEETSARLQESVHQLITLTGEETPSAVSSPMSARFIFRFSISPVLQNDELATERPVPPRSFRSIREAHRYYKQRLLLLGGPGAGKTTTLLAAARDAAVARLNDSEQPVPVLASIHTWDRHEPLAQWSQAQAQGADFTGQRVLYLLDGLDELKRREEKEADPRLLFIQRVRDELASDQVVITSRITDYEEIGLKLALPGAVTLCPLIDEQIEDYLEVRHQTYLWQALQADPALMDMARTPLLLSLLSIAYEDEAGNAEFSLAGIEESKIFDRYVHRRFVHEAAKPSPLPFDESTSRQLLETLAAHLYPEVSIDCQEAEHALGEEAKGFLDFGRRMHLLQPLSDGKIQFIHLKLRDHFAFLKLINMRDDSGFIAGEASYKLTEGTNFVPPLVKTLRLGDPASRASAAWALGTIKALHSTGVELGQLTGTHLLNSKEEENILAALIDGLTVDEHNVYGFAHIALGHFGELAVRALLKAVQGPDDHRRERAASAIAQFGESALPELLGLLQSADEKTRVLAVGALLRMNNPTAVPGLIAALGDGDRDVSTMAAFALSVIEDERAMSALLEALKNGECKLRRMVAIVLGENGIALAEPVLIDCLSDTSRPFSWGVITKGLSLEGIRMCDLAAETLEKLATPAALAALTKWRTDQGTSG